MNEVVKEHIRKIGRFFDPIDTKRFAAATLYIICLSQLLLVLHPDCQFYLHSSTAEERKQKTEICYLFMGVCGFGVWSAAVATVISQIAMTVYIIVFAVRKYPLLRFSVSHTKDWLASIKNGRKYALPPAVQSSVTSVGNIFLQGFMNTFGEQTVAAVTTAYRVDSVLLLPIVNFSTAISTIVARETGAGNGKAAKKVFHLGTIMMAIMSVGLTAVIILTGKTLLSMFGLTRRFANAYL